VYLTDFTVEFYSDYMKALVRTVDTHVGDPGSTPAHTYCESLLASASASSKNCSKEFHFAYGHVQALKPGNCMALIAIFLEG